MQVCKSCEIEKDFLDFRKSEVILLSGEVSVTYRKVCKKCVYKNTDKNKTREYDRKWKAEYRKTHKKTKQERHEEYLKYRDKQLEYHRQYDKENKARILEYGRNYRKTPNGRKKLRDGFYKYEAKKKSVFVEYVDRDIVFERDKGICHICRLPVSEKIWHLEHIIPLSRGGLHCYKNVAVSHARCNSSKRNKTIDEYRKHMEKKSSESNKPKRPYYKK